MQVVIVELNVDKMFPETIIYSSSNCKAWKKSKCHAHHTSKHEPAILPGQDLNVRKPLPG